MLTSRYAVAGPQIVSEAFDGDIVVLDLESGRYFSFTDSGCALWEGLAEGVAPEALLAEDTVQTPDQVQAFLQELIDYKLLAAVAEPAIAVVPADTLDQLKRAKDAPAVTVYDDLADLFLADPIHDVEAEAGWPVVNKA